MARIYKNNAYGVLSASIADVTTSVALVTGNGARFPSPTNPDYFSAALIGLDSNGNENAWEIVQCTARSSDTLTIVRAQQGTAAVSWPAGTRIELRMTAADLDDKLSRTGEAPTFTAASADALALTLLGRVSDNAAVARFVGSDGTTETARFKSVSGGGIYVATRSTPSVQAAFDNVASAVNWLLFSGAATGNGPALSAVGGDTNVNLGLIAQGAGVVLAKSPLRADKAMQQKVVALGAGTAIDLTAGDYFTKTISGATTFTVTGTPPSGVLCSFVLELTNPGALCTFWATPKNPSGTAYTGTASGRDKLIWSTIDGGTTWDLAFVQDWK